MVLKFKTTILETGESIEAGMDETITFIESHVDEASESDLDHLARLMADGEAYGDKLEWESDLMDAIRTAGKRLHVDVQLAE